MKNNLTIINKKREDNLRIKLEDKDTTSLHGLDMHNGKKMLNNSLDQDLFIKELLRLSIPTKDYG